MKALKWVKWMGIPILVAMAFTLQNWGEIEITTAKGTLYGTLEKSNEKTGEVVVLIAGSGPTDRDSNSLVLPGRMDSFLQLSNALKDEGYTVFRYDKRTAGKSRDSFGPHDMVFDDFVQDAILVVEEMENRGYQKIHLIGHSQGALIATLVAQQKSIASVTHLCGASVPIDEAFLRQLEVLPKELYAEAEGIFARIGRGEEIGVISEELESLFSDHMAPFMLNWMQYNPVEEALTVSAPILFVAGGEDSQVLEDSLDDFRVNFSDTDIQLIPNMNHVLKTVHSDRENQQSYQDPSYPLSPELVEAILEFYART